MTNRTHDAIAFASLVAVAMVFPPSSLNLMTLFVAIIGADIGATIPDMDQAGNRLWDLLPAGDFVGKIFRKVFFEHRTISHSIIGTVIIYELLRIVLTNFLNPEFLDPKIILTSVMIGYVSHLIADSLTKQGLPLLFPLKYSFGFPPIKKLRIKTGKFVENFLIFPAVWIFLISLIYFNQEKIIKIIDLVGVNS